LSDPRAKASGAAGLALYLNVAPGLAATDAAATDAGDADAIPGPPDDGDNDDDDDDDDDDDAGAPDDPAPYPPNTAADPIAAAWADPPFAAATDAGHDDDAAARGSPARGNPSPPCTAAESRSSMVLWLDFCTTIARRRRATVADSPGRPRCTDMSITACSTARASASAREAVGITSAAPVGNLQSVPASSSVASPTIGCCCVGATGLAKTIPSKQNVQQRSARWRIKRKEKKKNIPHRFISRDMVVSCMVRGRKKKKKKKKKKSFFFLK
jgi:hypothetical protein